MMGVVHPFPSSCRPSHGTIHVGGDKEGFTVSHESASGNSWGSFLGPFATGQEAITAAYALNRDTYASECDVSVCAAALLDRAPEAGPNLLTGDF